VGCFHGSYGWRGSCGAIATMTTNTFPSRNINSYFGEIRSNVKATLKYILLVALLQRDEHSNILTSSSTSFSVTDCCEKREPQKGLSKDSLNIPILIKIAWPHAHKPRTNLKMA
jgi:hypothetical protein